MNKMNKKGFTLIEMLVVIAIIAVLVSIIIPVVTNSTAKAEAATNAANLRSVKAEIVTKILTGEISSASDYKISSSVKFYGTGSFEATGDKTSGVTVKFGGKTIDEWAIAAGQSGAVAGGGAGSGSSEVKHTLENCTGTITDGKCSVVGCVGNPATE